MTGISPWSSRFWANPGIKFTPENLKNPFKIGYFTKDDWANDGSYKAILGGEYTKRNEKEESFAQDFAEASKQYQDDLKGSQDPLAQTVSNIGEGLENAGKEALKFFGSNPSKLALET